MRWKAGDVVQVRVTEVDVARKRIGLTMRSDGGASASDDRNSRPDHHAGRKSETPHSGKSRSPVKDHSPSNALRAALLEAMKKR